MLIDALFFPSSLIIVSTPFSRYIYLMSITQTVEIPPSRRLTIDVPLGDNQA
jgi:hypothetical protein